MMELTLQQSKAFGHIRHGVFWVKKASNTAHVERSGLR
jgi:hypothetical protein